MIRHRLTNEQWNRIAELIPGKPGDPGRTGDDNRLFVDAIVWMARTGAPWRGLSPCFGNWNSVHKRFRRWAKAGVWERILEALADPDLESVIIDGTIIRVHQRAAGGKGDSRTSDRAIAWRPEHENPHRRRCSRQCVASALHRRPDARVDHGRGVDRRSAGSEHPWRQGFRL